jgi:hypothetical protein
MATCVDGKQRARAPAQGAVSAGVMDVPFGLWVGPSYTPARGLDTSVAPTSGLSSLWGLTEIQIGQPPSVASCPLDSSTLWLTAREPPGSIYLSPC